MMYDHFDGKTTFFKASDRDTLEIQNSNPEDLEKLPRLSDNHVPFVIAALVDKVKQKGSNNPKNYQNATILLVNDSEKLF